MKQFFLVLLSVLLIVYVGGCDDDKTPTGSSGASLTVIASRNGQPLDSALVVISLSTHTDNVVAAGTTGDDGESILSGVDGGTYSLNVSKSIAGQLVYGTESEIQIADNEDLTQSLEVNQQAADFFPLALGNTWTFEVGDDSTMTIGVFSTKMVGDVVTYTFGPLEGAHPPYMTRGVTSVYWHGWELESGGDHILPSPVVFLDFSASVGDDWTIPEWGSVELVATGLEIEVPAGTFQDCHHFEITSDAAISEYWNAPGIGPVQMTDSDGLVWKLLSYELN